MSFSQGNGFLVNLKTPKAVHFSGQLWYTLFSLRNSYSWAFLAVPPVKTTSLTQTTESAGFVEPCFPIHNHHCSTNQDFLVKNLECHFKQFRMRWNISPIKFLWKHLNINTCPSSKYGIIFLFNNHSSNLTEEHISQYFLKCFLLMEENDSFLKNKIFYLIPE